MRLLPQPMGLIEIEGTIDWQRLVSAAEEPGPPAAPAEPVYVLAANLASLTHELHVEWRALVQRAC